MSKVLQSTRAKMIHWTRRVILYVVLLLVAFLLGFVPMWWKSHECSRDLAKVEHQLSLTRLQNALASAVIDARLGDYEPARQAASDFFTFLRAETGNGGASSLSSAQRERALPLLTQRDEIITLLARSDSASADQLSDLYVAYCKAVGIK